MKNVQVFAFADEASPMIDEQIKAMQRNGLQGLEIRSVDGENVSGISIAKAKEVYKKISDAGLCIWSIGSPIGKIDISQDDFIQHLDVLKRTIDIAQEMKCGNIRMFSFYLPKDQEPGPFKNEVMDRLHQMAELTAGSVVQLCHENEKGIYGDNAVRCREILSEVPEITGVFDPANFVQCGQDTLEAWNMLKGTENLTENEKLEILIMQVWTFNDSYTRKNETTAPTDEQAYIKGIIGLLIKLDNVDDLLKAELLRESGHFEEALELLKNYSAENDFLEGLKNKFIEHALASDTHPFIIYGD